MAVKTASRSISDWLKHEYPNGYCRETITIASGSGVIETGMVIAKVTATGKYVPVAASGSDGSQTAAGIFVCDTIGRTSIDATSADVKGVGLVRGPAIVGHEGLTYGSTVDTANERAAAHAQLAALNAAIIVRESA